MDYKAGSGRAPLHAVDCGAVPATRGSMFAFDPFTNPGSSLCGLSRVSSQPPTDEERITVYSSFLVWPEWNPCVCVCVSVKLIFDHSYCWTRSWLHTAQCRYGNDFAKTAEESFLRIPRTRALFLDVHNYLRSDLKTAPKTRLSGPFAGFPGDSSSLVQGTTPRVRSPKRSSWNQ